MKKALLIFAVVLLLFPVLSMHTFADTSGSAEFYIDTGLCEISGDAGVENVGAKITLMLSDKNTDILTIKPENIGYIGQTEVSENGTYSFKFNLKTSKKLDDYDVTVKNGRQDLSSTLKNITYHMYKGYGVNLDIERTYQGIEANTVLKQISDDNEGFTSCTFTVAFYDIDNKLISLSEPATLDLTAETEKTIISEVPQGAAKAKALVWHDFENIVPLLPSKEVDCGEIGEYKVVFPGYTTKALTMSYDDGDSSDERLVEIFNANNIKATFNVYRDNQAYKTLYAGHEIASHSKGHINMSLSAETVATTEECVAAIEDGKTMVDKLLGEGACKGFVWPYGVPSNREDFETIMQAVKDNYLYARPVIASKSMDLPTDWYNWQATCHHDNVYDYTDEFLADDGELKLLYVWGHSYQLLDKYQAEDGSTMTYDELEEFCIAMGERSDVWKATNYEVYEYVNAMRTVERSDNYIYNPSEIDLYVIIDGNKTLLKSKQYVGGTN